MCKDDEVRLRHMLDAAREVLGFVQDRNRADLDSDRQLVLALVKDIEIIGEAAFQTSENTRGQLQRFPGTTLSACAIVLFTPISTSIWISSGRRCRVTWHPHLSPRTGAGQEKELKAKEEAATVKLYEVGRLSSGAAAKLAGVPRAVFLTKFADYGVDTFRLTEEQFARETRLA